MNIIHRNRGGAGSVSPTNIKSVGWGGVGLSCVQPPTPNIWLCKKITVLPEYTSSFTLASSINMFLLRKFIILKWNFLFWKCVYQRIRLLI